MKKVIFLCLSLFIANVNALETKSYVGIGGTLGIVNVKTIKDINFAQTIYLPGASVLVGTVITGDDRQMDVGFGIEYSFFPAANNSHIQRLLGSFELSPKLFGNDHWFRPYVKGLGGYAITRTPFTEFEYKGYVFKDAERRNIMGITAGVGVGAGISITKNVEITAEYRHMRYLDDLGGASMKEPTIGLRFNF